jgi:hypothetical protein
MENEDKFEPKISRKSFVREKKRKKEQTAPIGVRYNNLRQSEGLIAFIAEQTVKPVKKRKK